MFNFVKSAPQSIATHDAPEKQETLDEFTARMLQHLNIGMQELFEREKERESTNINIPHAEGICCSIQGLALPELLKFLAKESGRIMGDVKQIEQPLQGNPFSYSSFIDDIRREAKKLEAIDLMCQILIKEATYELPATAAQQQQLINCLTPLAEKYRVKIPTYRTEEPEPSNASRFIDAINSFLSQIRFEMAKPVQGGRS